MRKVIELITGICGGYFILGSLACIAIGTQNGKLANKLYDWVAAPAILIGVPSMMAGVFLDELNKPVTLRSKVVNRSIELPAKYNTEAGDALIKFLDMEDEDMEARDRYWPDEAYSDYVAYTKQEDLKLHYIQACIAYERDIVKHLAPFFGAKGPHPEICATCEGGPCTQLAACSMRYLWTEPGDYLLELAANKLRIYEQGPEQHPVG